MFVCLNFKQCLTENIKTALFLDNNKYLHLACKSHFPLVALNNNSRNNTFRLHITKCLAKYKGSLDYLPLNTIVIGLLLAKYGWEPD